MQHCLSMRASFPFRKMWGGGERRIWHSIIGDGGMKCTIRRWCVVIFSLTKCSLLFDRRGPFFFSSSSSCWLASSLISHVLGHQSTKSAGSDLEHRPLSKLFHRRESFFLSFFLCGAHFGHVSVVLRCTYNTLLYVLL